MGGSMAKRKGSSFEREIASDLSEAYDLPFTRTLSSGAFVGGKNKHRKSGLSKSMINASLGDIVTPDNWNLVVECKSYADLDFHGLLTDGVSKLKGWIHEVRFDAESEINHMVVFKIVRKGTFIVLPYNEYFVEQLISLGLCLSILDINIEEEHSDVTSARYVVLDWDILSGGWDMDRPQSSDMLKKYIEYIAGLEVSN